MITNGSFSDRYRIPAILTTLRYDQSGKVYSSMSSTLPIPSQKRRYVYVQEDGRPQGHAAHPSAKPT
jgi:hypothetical protein